MRIQIRRSVWLERSALLAPLVCALWIGACTVDFGRGETPCGNGQLDTGEECDDGNRVTGDGCDATCIVELGYVCVGVPSVCAQTCGNGVLDTGEGCDDGNLLALDGCEPDCEPGHGYYCVGQPSVCEGDCGDGLIAVGDEDCDDGNTDAGDGCSNDCAVESGYECTGEPSTCEWTCGDGVLNADEECDDGALLPNDGCSPECDVEPGYSCTGEPSVCATICGDGVVAVGMEGCDDGNSLPGDGCGADCIVETGWVCFGEPSTCAQTCGNGALDTGEVCDDGNNAACDGCAADCSRADNVCGDGFTECGEGCDDANTASCDGCSADCSRVDDACGDGIIECGEQCEGSDFGGATCASETGGTLPDGNLICTGSCTIDTSGCTVPPCAHHYDCPQGQQCGSAGCAPVGNTCNDSPFVLSTSGTYNHTTENLTNDINIGNGGLGCPSFTFQNSNGLDRVYQIDVNAGDYFTVWVHPQGWNPVLGLFASCPLTTCIAGRDAASQQGNESPERLDYIATSTQTLYLVVDGDDDEGDYTLEFSRGSATDWTPLGGSGQVLFSEVHPDPDGNVLQVEDECEWFEIYNPDGVQARSLEGARFVTPNGDFFVGHTLLIGPQEHMVFAPSTNHLDNCGLMPVSSDYGGTNFDLWKMTPCDLELRDASNSLVDAVYYTSSWPHADGRSMYLCTNHLNAADNDNPSSWDQTPAQSQYLYAGGGYTNFGSPAQANPGTCN